VVGELEVVGALGCRHDRRSVGGIAGGPAQAGKARTGNCENGDHQDWLHDRFPACL
jgi:hypothetical protein